MCCSRKGDGTDPFAEVTLQPLPQYVIPSDGITMTSVACTDRGHIFLAGRDGHIYELQYTTGSGWYSKHCRKVCLTAGLEGVISRCFSLLSTLLRPALLSLSLTFNSRSYVRYWWSDIYIYIYIDIYMCVYVYIESFIWMLKVTPYELTCK